MADENNFDLRDFLPYLLNQAAEESSLEFQTYYKSRFGMLRMEWRVLFHLGRYGEMTATELGRRSKLHKTKISRAVRALEKRRFLKRTTMDHDRRHELLELIPQGKKAYSELLEHAREYDHKLISQFDAVERQILRSCLLKLAKL